MLLIAARRADQISAELAMHDYTTNLEAFELLKELHELAQGAAGPSTPTAR